MLNKKNEIKIFIIVVFSLIIYYNNNVILNSNIENLDEIIIIIKKFLDPKSIPILTENEKLVASYWKTELFCPFSKLVSHGLTQEEAILIIDFFQIEDISQLDKLDKFLKEHEIE